MIGKLLKNFFFFLMAGSLLRRRSLGLSRIPPPPPPPRRRLDGRWGPHSVDCFANYYNHKLPKFFSRFWNSNTSGVDFFFQSLRGENCLVVPPVGIVPHVLHYLKSQQAVGTLVVPLWPSAHFWPLITHKYNSYLVDHSVHIGKEVLTRGRNPNSLRVRSFHRKYYCL